jgi:hypothetical protein
VVKCGTLVNAVAIPPEKPLNGLSLVNVTGTCTNAIALANIRNAEFRDVRVTGYAGSFLTCTNVLGVGVENPR